MPTLELTDDQLYTVLEACDLYARIRTGHFDQIWSVLAYDSEKNCGQPVPDIQMWKALCDLLTRFWFPNLPYMSQNWGVGHDVKADRSWTIYEVIREFQTNDKDVHRAMNWVSGEKMPKVYE